MPLFSPERVNWYKKINKHIHIPVYPSYTCWQCANFISWLLHTNFNADVLCVTHRNTVQTAARVLQWRHENVQRNFFLKFYIKLFLWKKVNAYERPEVELHSFLISIQDWSSQLHDHAVLDSEKAPPEPIKYNAAWAPEPLRRLFFSTGTTTHCGLYFAAL